MNSKPTKDPQDLVQEFLDHFRQYKVVKQKAFYVGAGAEMYYGFQLEKVQQFLEREKQYLHFLKAQCLSPGKKVAFVSLGCGNALKEKMILSGLTREGYDVELFAIDSSAEMIDLAERQLKGESFGYHLYCEDFSSEQFLRELHASLEGFDIKLYGFLGATFGNVQQDYMADILFDMLEPGDKLWLEVVVRTDKKHATDRKSFERYLGWLDEKKHRDFLYKPLHDFNIPVSNGELYVEMKKEEVLGALRFVFGFRFTEKTTINFRGHTITLLPGTTVALLTIRAYDADGLIRFFEERSFTFVASEEGRLGQFLFERRSESA